ncbi:MAG: nuclear transport factor 2 family protein [Thermomicrobiales bacterium]
MGYFALLVSSLAVVAIGSLAVTHMQGTAAQDATPDVSPAALPPLLQQLVDAANANDGAAIAALYAEDGTHEDVPAGVVARGREEIAAYVDGVGEQVSDISLEPVFGRLADDLAVLEYTFSATDLATGRPVVYRGVLVFELDGNLIRRGADYYDFAAVLRQLGLLETDEATPEATPAP